MRNQSYFGMMPGFTFGGSRVGIKNPVISMLSDNLDERIYYSGPSHSCIDKNGSIYQSVPNNWPLEYSGGVAVGRHEPEKKSTNLVLGNQYESIGSSGSNTDWIYSVGANITTGLGDIGFLCAVSGDTAKVIGVYNEQTSQFIYAPTFTSVGSSWVRAVLKLSNNQRSPLRFYTARVSSTNYLYGKVDTAEVGQLVGSVYRRTSGSNLLSGMAQIESGQIATSPILTPQGSPKERAASSVTINEPMAKQAIVTYTDGSRVTLNSVGGVITLPASSADWGYRYIVQIELIG